MEMVVCDSHGRPCLLKTGVKDGPNKGRSFYVCSARRGTPCDFAQVADVPPSHCLHHEDALVELQALLHSEEQQCYRLFFRCVLGKNEGKKWCGSVPWKEQKHCDRSRQLNGQSQFSSCPRQRNPFKASSKTGKASEWRNLEEGRNIGGEKSRMREAEEGEIGAEAKRNDCSDDEDSKSSWRNKQLPAGVRLKKKVTDEAQCGDCEPRRRPAPANAARVACPDSRDETEHQTRGEQQQKTRPADGKVPEEGSSPGAEDQQKDSCCHEEAAKRESSSETWRQPQEGRAVEKEPPSKREEPETDDGVLLVSVKPGTKQKPPASNPVQTTLTSLPGFRLASHGRAQQGDPRVLHDQLSVQLKQKKATLSTVNVLALPDKGERLKNQVKELEDALQALSLTGAASGCEGKPEPLSSGEGVKVHAAPSQTKPVNKQGGTILLPEPPVSPAVAATSLELDLSQGYSQAYRVTLQSQALYGGRMTEDRLLAVRNATTEAIDHLHRSLESCPGPHTEEPDPAGLKVPLLPHQRCALAWLLWRETQKPCGGILADDMGLGKTLTMIALILAQRKAEEKVKKVEGWISKNDESLVASQSTLIICPASLIHHWKNEIERRVGSRHLSVYLYHGPSRQRSASFLAGQSVVVTTYSLVSKEMPLEKENVEKASQDAAEEVIHLSPLLRVLWARVILDEAHNIKNPKVQTSIAVCKLRAKARWAVTGTPVQNNLLDMYALLKFLRCSPFDEYKLWKAQVDNGSKRGGERLNILTRALLLRRTKDELDAHGKPLVPLPERVCEVHHIKLSEDEKAVYDVIFAQSRSTLQSYLKRHEGGESAPQKDTNPFQKANSQASARVAVGSYPLLSLRPAADPPHVQHAGHRLCGVKFIEEKLRNLEDHEAAAKM
ncbi:transcription termination factor 2-like [Arapaima gigas]